MRRAAILPILLLAALGCDRKAESFFRPAAARFPDETPPRFADPMPGPGIAVVSTDAFTIDVSDPSDGGAASGIDAATIEATAAGLSALTVQQDLPHLTIDVAGLPEGLAQVAVSLRDRAGNSAVYIFSHVLDRIPPPIALENTPPPAVTVSDPSLTATVMFTIGPEPHYGSGTLEVRTPGDDDACGTADDGTVPAEVLANPSRDLPTAGGYTLQFGLDNPVPAGGAAVQASYCWVVRAVDTAQAPDGTTGVNASVEAARTDVTWEAPGP